MKKMTLLGCCHLLVVLLNLFFTDRDPEKCAENHGDKHLHKMILEYAQIASTVYRLVDKDYAGKRVYRKVQPTSNVVQWAAASHAHFIYVVRLGLALSSVRESRRKSTWKSTGRHKSEPCLLWLARRGYPIYFPDDEWLCDPPLRMPDCCKVDHEGRQLDAVSAYRLYTAYKVHSIGLKFDTGCTPEFLEGCLRDIRERRPDIRAELGK